MTKKKKAPKSASFTEAIGIKNFFQNDIFNFIFGFIILIFAVYLIAAFISYLTTGQADQSILLDMRPGEWLNTSHEFQNYCGSMGALLAYFFVSRCFGLAAFFLPVILIIIGLKMVHAYPKLNVLKWFLGLGVIMVWCSVMFAKFLTPIMGDQVFNPGGDHGLFCCQWLENVVGVPGLTAVLGLVAILFLTYVSNETIQVIRKILNPIAYITKGVRFTITYAQDKTEDNSDDNSPQEADADGQKTNTNEVIYVVDTGKNDTNSNGGNGENGNNSNPSATNNTTNSTGGNGIDRSVEVPPTEEKSDSKQLATPNNIDTPINPREPWLNYKFPTLDLLKKYESTANSANEEEQNNKMNRIVQVLGTFGVTIKSIKATVGPTITLYEVTPAEGVRIRSIRSLGEDIALSLAAKGIRIIAPIPGKGTVGIEIPNDNPQIVSMESILNSKRFKETTMDLPIALGKTITGDIFMLDLAKIPHLLVAGATGQGKSVGLNAIITSLLYKKHPNELKLILVDPKKVEFSVYADIANHFMAKIPDETGEEDAIITDVKKVVNTLNSLCKLMDHRYDLLKMAGVRNIKEYNKKYVEHKLRLTDGHEYLPYIVLIIDEFADLIMTAGKEVELPLARIAQLARAVGIHAIVATQRPIVKVITGIIKANFPGRIAFKVTSRIDSSTILDQSGAEQLVGRGDMLYCNGGEPIRVQCALVDTPEVESINKYIQQQEGPTEPFELPEPSTDEEGTSSTSIDSHNLDPLFEEAARSVVASQQGSTSMIQRRFSIGYNRAGRLMDQLQEAGVVGEAHGSKPREVLYTDLNSLETLLTSLRR